MSFTSDGGVEVVGGVVGEGGVVGGARKQDVLHGEVRE